MTPDDDAECPTCGRSFSTRTRMERHAKAAHGGVHGGIPWRKVAAALAVAAVAVVGWTLVSGPDAETSASLMEEFGADDDPFLGNASAPVVVVTFETPACPSCKRFHTEMFPGIQAEYIDAGEVRYHYAQFTIGARFDEPGGIAQECVARYAGNEAFFNFTTLLYERQGQVNADNVDDLVRDFADRNGYDAGPMVSCYHDRETKAQYDQDLDKGRSNGVSGTPYFFVWGPGNSATATGATGLRDAIEDKLAGSGGGA